MKMKARKARRKNEMGFRSGIGPRVGELGENGEIKNAKFENQ
jgi:hypothetical protein